MKVYRFKCKDCGATKYEKLDENTYECKYCGYIEEVHREEKVEKPEEVERPQDETVVDYSEIRPAIRTNPEATHIIILLITCIIGGVVGLHKFLDRKFISGFIYLFTGGLFGIGIFIDIIVLVIRLAHVRGDGNIIDYERGDDYRND